jgi:hypothetical protein
MESHMRWSSHGALFMRLAVIASIDMAAMHVAGCGSSGAGVADGAAGTDAAPRDSGALDTPAPSDSGAVGTALDAGFATADADIDGQRAADATADAVVLSDAEAPEGGERDAGSGDAVGIGAPCGDAETSCGVGLLCCASCGAAPPACPYRCTTPVTGRCPLLP